MLKDLYLLGVRRPGMVLAGLAALTIFFGSGLPGLGVDTRIDSLIPSSDTDRVIYQRVLEEFGRDDKTIIYVRDGGLWSPGKLADLERLHHALEMVNGVGRVDSLFTLHGVARVDGAMQSGPVIDRVPQTAEEAQALRDRVLANPLYEGEFYSAGGDAVALLVSIDNPGLEPDGEGRVHAEIQRLLDARADTYEEVFQIGNPRLYAEFRENLIGDFRLLGPLSAVILVLAILFFMRSFLATFIPVLISALAIVWTFGMLAWTGIPVSILSVTLPSLVIIIAATASLHLISAYMQGMKSPERGGHEAMTAALARRTGLPFMLTLLVMLLGFVSNAFNDIDLIRDFALASAFGVAVIGVLTILLAPMLLTLYRRASPGFIERRNDPGAYPGRLLRSFSWSQTRYPRAILAVTAGLCAFFFYHASTLEVTNDPFSYFREGQPLLEDRQQVQEDLSGASRFFITLESNTENAFLEPRNVARLAEIQEFIAGQGAFDRSRSFADFLAYIHREVLGEQPGLALPRTRQLVAQYLLLFHRTDIDAYVSHDYTRANIVVQHNLRDSALLNDYIDELREVVAHAAGAELTAHVVGGNLMVNRAAESLKSAQVKALVILLSLIFVIVSILFTSMKGGFIAVVSAVIPIALMFGIMGLLDIPLNPGTAMVAVIAIGLAVDGTIHLLTRYNELSRLSADNAAAVRVAVGEVAPPLIVSSLALSMGFGILVFSSFTVVAQFGALVTATLLFSIFANLMITPLIMTRIRLVGLYQILSMNLDEETLGRCALFRDMSEYQRRKAILISEWHEFAEGELLIEQDTVGRSMYLILTGEAEVLRRDGEKQHVLATLKPGQVFGEIGYIRETRRTADVRARTPITALRFDYERLQKDLKYFPNIVAKLNFNISYILGERLADMVEHQKG